LKDHGAHGITFVQGGFSSVGGIESFASDLLCALRARQIPVRLICWNAGAAERTLDSFLNAGISVHSSAWRWGCRWGWPDKVMARQEWKKLVEADLLVFGKLLHEDVHRGLARLDKRMILITPYRPAEMWGRRRPDDLLLNSFEAIVVQASSFGEDLRAFGYRGRIVTLPYLPPEVSEPAPWPQTGLLQIGFLGRLVPEKNVKYLLVAFSRLREMGIEARLHLYGEGPERDALQSLTAQLELTDQVRFHGGRRRGEIAAAIDRCHLFAFSSSTEGQCLAALEILARGRPVVGTPVGALPEILGDGTLGLVAPLNDPPAFAAAVEAVAQPVLEGRITPLAIQEAYMKRFPRQQVIEGYMREFGCSDSIDQKIQAI
jgi:glycosyltransferase involved in cell wall biosynthesis